MALDNRYYIYNSENKPYLEVAGKGGLSFLDKLFGSILSVGHNLYIKQLDGSEVGIIKKDRNYFGEIYNIL